MDNPKFEFINEDICNYESILELTKGYDLISHQAALGSVPRSIENPMLSTNVNILGTVNILHAAVINNIERVVLACSSSTYGDSRELPKVEERIGLPLSPYAVTKYSIELFAHVFHLNYGLNYIGFRYFNVFGPKQNPDNPYAAVIPIFCKSFIENREPTIYGDGLTSRDFTFVDNVVNANNIALFTTNNKALNEIYNIAVGEQTSLNEMIELLHKISNKKLKPIYSNPRSGDVKHSKADISKARELLDYQPKVHFAEGLKSVYNWYKNIYGQY